MHLLNISWISLGCRKGSVVSLPHCEQLVFVSARGAEFPPPPPSVRFALQPLQRFVSFLNPLSAKNICSPEVKTNSAPHSEHFSTLSWNSITPLPLDPYRAGAGLLHVRPDEARRPMVRERRARIPWAFWHSI